MTTTWFGFYLEGRHVGWQQLVRRPLDTPEPLLRREVLTAFALEGDLVLSGFFAEAPVGEPLAWRSFGTLVETHGAWVEAVAFERRGSELLHPDGRTSPLPEVSYPGQLFLELAISMLRRGPADLTATPIGDADGSLEEPVHLRIGHALEGPLNATHQVEERAGGRAVLLAPDQRPERQVWGPVAWSGPATTRALAKSAGPEGVVELT